MTPTVCVIIPTFNHFEYARRAVQSLLRCPVRRTRIRYLLVDDASPEWDAVDWNTWPEPDCHKLRFARRGGLTRSWNAGLRVAVSMGAEYAVCTNSDVLFSPQWFAPLADALENGFHLVGPVTNAPGDAPAQDVQCYLPDAKVVTDSPKQIDSIARALRKAAPVAVSAPINGFFMMAKTERWRQGAFSRHCVFDPGFPLVGNETELQKRWKKAGMVTGFVPSSFVFHYRSVSRPEGLMGKCGGGAFRR